MESVGHDFVRRVRWGNVALACVVAVALAGVVVWPLVTSDPPALPPDASRPLIVAEPPPPVGDGGRPAGPDTRRQGDDETRTRPGERGKRAARRRDGKPPRPKRRRGRPAATPLPAPTVVPRRVVPTSPPSAEFGFER